MRKKLTKYLKKVMLNLESNIEEEKNKLSLDYTVLICNHKLQFNDLYGNSKNILFLYFIPISRSQIYSRLTE